MSSILTQTPYKTAARIGLSAKGLVYCLLGILTFMAAFGIAGASAQDADKAGVFDFILHRSGGRIILLVLAAGLLCYCVWRGVQAFGDTEQKGKNAKGLAVRGRYLFSGLLYASIAFSAARMAFSGHAKGGDSQENFARELLQNAAGAWLAGLAAAALLGNGIYQIWYGLAGKFRKHLDRPGSSSDRAFVVAGKVGYVARGIVWLLLGGLFLRAALRHNASHAGDTSKAFSWVGGEAFGPLLLGAIGLGLFCYGLFNFVRVKQEEFG